MLLIGLDLPPMFVRRYSSSPSLWKLSVPLVRLDGFPIVDSIDVAKTLLNTGAERGRFALIMPSSGTSDDSRGIFENVYVMSAGSRLEKTLIQTDVIIILKTLRA